MYIQNCFLQTVGGHSEKFVIFRDRLVAMKPKYIKSFLIGDNLRFQSNAITNTDIDIRFDGDKLDEGTCNGTTVLISV